MYLDKRIFGLPSIDNYELYESNFYGSVNPSNLTQMIRINPKYDPKTSYSNLNKSKKPFINGIYDKNEEKMIFFNEQQTCLLQNAVGPKNIDIFEKNENNSNNERASNTFLNNEWTKQEEYVEQRDKIAKFIPDMVSTKMRTRYFFEKDD